MRWIQSVLLAGHASDDLDAFGIPWDDKGQMATLLRKLAAILARTQEEDAK